MIDAGTRDERRKETQKNVKTDIDGTVDVSEKGTNSKLSVSLKMTKPTVNLTQSSSIISFTYPFHGRLLGIRPNILGPFHTSQLSHLIQRNLFLISFVN